MSGAEPHAFLNAGIANKLRNSKSVGTLVYTAIGMLVCSLFLLARVSSMEHQQIPQYSKHFRILVLGDTKGKLAFTFAACFTLLVGKSAIILQYMKWQFADSYKVN